MVRYCKNGNIGVIEFDDPDSKVNLLSNKNLDMLGHIIDHIIKDDNYIKALFFISRKSDIFIAGADIKELAAILTKEEALRLCKKGQDLFNKIASLNMPTFAVVNGACVGGGLELALSCDYILATRNKKVRFALPEVKLGIVPGFGGSYRLKKKIGAKKARSLIDTGKFLNAKEARCLKVVDKIIPEKDSFLYPKLMRIHRHSRKLTAKNLSLSENKRKLELDKLERELLARKILQSSARNGLSSYLLISKYRNIYLQKGPKETLPIERCVVIGAGTMGRGITYLINSHGLPVRLEDTNEATLRKAKLYIKNIYKDALQRGILNRDEAGSRFKRISYGKGQSRDADLVVESISEDTLIKKFLFAETEHQFNSRCILTTNTSCLSIEELSKPLRNAERFLGMHFFNPAYKMKLVEVVPTRFTSKLVLETVISFLRRIGRIPIIVKDRPGFLVNRLLLPYLNEALFMLEQGFSRGGIDSAMTGFGMPVGPLQLLSDIGPEVAYKASKTLEENFGSRMRLSDTLKASAKKVLQLEGKRSLSHRALTPRTSQDIIERLLHPMRREAELCLKEGVVENREIIDLALLLGIGFPGSKRIWKK